MCDKQDDAAVDANTAVTTSEINEADEHDDDDSDFVWVSGDDFVMLPGWTEMAIDDKNNSNNNRSSSTSGAASAEASCDRATPTIRPRTGDAQPPAAEGYDDAAPRHAAKPQLKSGGTSTSSDSSSDSSNRRNDEKNDSSGSNDEGKNHNINGGGISSTSNTHKKCTLHNDSDDDDAMDMEDEIVDNMAFGLQSVALRAPATATATATKPRDIPRANLQTTSPSPGLLLLRPRPLITPLPILRRYSPRAASLPREAPPLPPLFVSRPRLLESCIEQLTTADIISSSALPYCLDLFGASGVGKTVLASSVIRAAEVQKHFWQGIFWLRVGRVGMGCRLRTLLLSLAVEVVERYHYPDSATAGAAAAAGAAVAALRDAVTLSRPASSAEELVERLAAVNEAGTMFRRRLVVLDDVWDTEVVVALRRAKFHVLATSVARYFYDDGVKPPPPQQQLFAGRRVLGGGASVFDSWAAENVCSMAQGEAVKVLGLLPEENVETADDVHGGADPLWAATPCVLKVRTYFFFFLLLFFSCVGGIIRNKCFTRTVLLVRTNSTYNTMIR